MARERRERGSVGVCVFAGSAIEPNHKKLSGGHYGFDCIHCPVWVMRTPMGDFGVVLLEGDDPIAANAAFASSQDPFDLWFKQNVKEFTGIDFGQPVPPTEQLLDWRA